MRRQSLAFPCLLMLGGIAAALYFGLTLRCLACVAACLVAAIGFHELRTTRVFNQDMERFERE